MFATITGSFFLFIAEGFCSHCAEIQLYDAASKGRVSEMLELMDGGADIDYTIEVCNVTVIVIAVSVFISFFFRRLWM